MISFDDAIIIITSINYNNKYDNNSSLALAHMRTLFNISSIQLCLGVCVFITINLVYYAPSQVHFIINIFHS